MFTCRGIIRAHNVHTARLRLLLLSEGSFFANVISLHTWFYILFNYLFYCISRSIPPLICENVWSQRRETNLFWLPLGRMPSYLIYSTLQRMPLDDVDYDPLGDNVDYSVVKQCPQKCADNIKYWWYQRSPNNKQPGSVKCFRAIRLLFARVGPPPPNNRSDPAARPGVRAPVTVMPQCI